MRRIKANENEGLKVENRKGRNKGKRRKDGNETRKEGSEEAEGN